MKWISTFYFVFLFHSLLAQQPDYLLKENSVWVFGRGDTSTSVGTGLNFNSGTSPTVFSSNIWGFGEAQASVCDTNGNLLFYTDGTYVWDAKGNMMPHGDSLVADTALYLFENPEGNNSDYDLGIDPTSSSVQGALIVPVLNNLNRYYVFSLTSAEFYGNPEQFDSIGLVSKGYGGELFYSIVDMSENNGLGDVISTQRGIFLDSNLTESMVAVAGTHCDVWVLVHGIDTPIIYAFNVNANGLNPLPVISNCGNFIGDYYYAGSGGAMKASPDRRKLAVCSYGGIELCDFDPATGEVSNSKTIYIEGYGIYQACFSPDNSKLYFNVGNIGSIYQYDLSDSVLNDSTLRSYGDYTDMQLGLDGKIYCLNSKSIDCIRFPNMAGLACDYTTSIIQHYPNSTPWLGLHNMYVKPIPMDSSMLGGCTCMPFIPNAFTPNKDGKNDVFHVLFPNGCLISNYFLSIYNRWGQEVFRTSDPSQGWDGVFQGVLQDIGTYMYTIKYSTNMDGQIKYKKGGVTLIR